MERYIMKKLIEWKNDKDRKPLILRGARQVGKTYILKLFGEQNYDNVAYFNFDHDKNLNSIFEDTKDPNKILEKLAFYNGKAIKPEKTLIIFDEIQECPNALNALKYFKEEANEYHIVCAGSLLGIKLSHTSFPVGKVDFMNMYPMTFTEFLKADGCNNLIEYMESINDVENIPDLFFNQLKDKLKAYFIIGGMPEVVNSWVIDKDMERVNKIQKDILLSYENDFTKHTTESEANKISLIWNNIPSQLARENKKFLYQALKEGARAREYEGAINWLYDADIIHKIYNSSKNAMPLKAYNDLSSFKIYTNDVGLLRRMTDLDSKIIVEANKLFEEFKGALTENFVLNMLLTIFENEPNYYTFDRYEVDFMIQYLNEIIPIEVKSGTSTNNTSFSKYNKENSPKYSIRFSLNNLKKDDNVINIPLFMIEYTKRFIK